MTSEVEPEGERPVVLVVDDVPANLLAVEASLQSDDYEVLTAGSGEEALELLLVHDVALAIVDVQMPGMDGFELATLMRGVERTRHVPIIFLTANARDEARAFTGYECGAVDYLFKPVDPTVLRGKVGVFVDLAKQRMQLREAKRMREMYMAMLGHDLRQPLGAMLMTVQLLASDPDRPDDEQASLRRVVRNGRRMKRMIHDLLDTTRFRNDGFIELSTGAARLDEVVAEVLEEIEDAGERVRVEKRGDLAGTWDVDRLLQISSNLIGNAARHSPAGSPVRVSIEGDTPETVAIHVHNGGPPIASEEQAVLFEPFRASGSTRRSRGLGLGLYITKKLVEAHGGTVTLASTEESGTTFSIFLPRHVRE
jgi:signal transduction histidine kinase